MVIFVLIVSDSISVCLLEEDGSGGSGLIVIDDPVATAFCLFEEIC